jgi:uncharacterized delta-60 repeat protein
MATSLALQPDGKIVVAGSSGLDFALARYNADGSLDAGFGSGGTVTTDFGDWDRAPAVAIQADGKIVVAGTTGGFYGPDDIALARYEGDPTSAARPPNLINLSTRSLVQTGDDVLIGGFTIGGSTPKTVLVRALGPTLTTFGVPGVLANPTVTLFAGATAIASNDDWQVADPLCASSGHTCGTPADIAATGLPPSNPLEAALLITLAPGPYTAIVSGVGGTTGIGLVGVFDVPGP